jgi:cbb3-type cytochrome oxidase maturation protein
MSVLFLLIPLAILAAIGSAIAFIWSVRTGQMDDLDTPPWRMLFDDTPGAPKNKP